MKRYNSKVTIIFLLLLMMSLPVVAQDYRLQSERYGTGGFSFEWWKANEDKISSFALPLTFIYPVNPKMRLYAMTSPAFTSLNTGATANLNGLSDIKWGGHYLILDDQYLVTFGMNLPMGKSKLKVEEYSVASVMSMPAFNFRVPSMGQGLDIQAGISSAREMSDFIIGYGISYLLKGGFTPFDGLDADYSPGNELTLTLGGDFGNIMADVLYTIYSADKYDGDKIYQSGNRLLLQAYWMTKVNDYDVVLLARERIKGKNKIQDLTSSGNDLETESKNSNANQFQVCSDWYRPYGQDSRIKLSVDCRLYSDSDMTKSGGATLFGFGGGIEKPLSPTIMFNADLKYFIGKIKTGTESVNAMGLNLFGGVQVVL